MVLPNAICNRLPSTACDGQKNRANCAAAAPCAAEHPRPAQAAAATTDARIDILSAVWTGKSQSSPEKHTVLLGYPNTYNGYDRVYSGKHIPSASEALLVFESGVLWGKKILPLSILTSL